MRLVGGGGRDKADLFMDELKNMLMEYFTRNLADALFTGTVATPTDS